MRSDMFFTLEKLEERRKELENYRYQEKQEIGIIRYLEADGKAVAPILPESQKNWKTGSIDMNWSGRDSYLWLELTVDIPESFQNRRVVGLFDFGKTGSGNNSGFESLLYLAGKPYQGVDINHQEVFLPQSYAGRQVKLLFRLWSGLEGGGPATVQNHKIKKAQIAWLDERADDLFYLSGMILETVRSLGNGKYEKYHLLKELNQAFLRINWSYPGSLEFYESVYQADEYLNRFIDGTKKDKDICIYCVGHTHIDLAWLWRLKHTREKASRSFSTVLRLMELYPEYIFLQTQPQIYEYVKEDFPELYDQIKERIADGRWEVNGAMWVEADCNLISGESLTRQILIGKKFVREEFGRDMTYLWLPDVFGYSWALPQILKKSGIDTFMTTKISWSQYNRMPHDTFWWRGIDGSEILTHFITTPDSNVDESRPYFYTYNGQLRPETVQGVWDNYRDKELNSDLLISYGYGDGGGGVNRDELEQRRRLDKIPGLPEVRTSNAKEYFDMLQKTIAATKSYVHVWDGELYLEYHRGTYTSHAYNKLMNRRMEELYRETEWLAAMAEIPGDSWGDMQEKLSEGWKIVLRNQFHDIIPGSSIKEVYEDSRVEYQEAKIIAEKIKYKSLMNLGCKAEGVFTVINNSNFCRTEAIELQGVYGGRFFNQEGNAYPSQTIMDKTMVLLTWVPPMSLSTLYYDGTLKAETVQSPFVMNTDRIDTPFYKIIFNKNGQITRLYDCENDREVLSVGERANILQMFEDKPLRHDAWDIDIYYQEKIREIDCLVSTEIIEQGAFRGILRRTWKYMNTVIVQDMIVYSWNRRIDFKTQVDFHEQHQLMKVAFPVNIRATYATYDIQYGNVRRPNNWNTSWDMARFETIGHRYADLSEYGYGVSLLNDCKYGYDIKDHVMRLSLIKSATTPDYEQDQGIHNFTYSLLPHQGDFILGKTVESAYALNQPLQVIQDLEVKDISFLRISSDLVEIDAIKISEDRKHLIIRLHDFAGASQQIKIGLGAAVKAWNSCNLMEELEGGYQTGDICFSLSPYEIKTIAVVI